MIGSRQTAGLSGTDSPQATTQIYTKVADIKRAEAIYRLDPQAA